MINYLEMTDEDLLKQILTADYGGMKVKKECLDEIIRRVKINVGKPNAEISNYTKN